MGYQALNFTLNTNAYKSAGVIRNKVDNELFAIQEKEGTRQLTREYFESVKPLMRSAFIEGFRLFTPTTYPVPIRPLK